MISVQKMSPSPSPPLRLEIPPGNGTMPQGGHHPPAENGGPPNHFHSISLRSPADQPVVLGFDGQGSVCNGSIGISGEKSPAEGNSQGQLIGATTKSAPSKWPPASLRRLCKFLSSRRFLLALVAFLTLFALLLIISLVLVILRGKRQHEEDAEFLNRDSSWRDGCERKCNAKFDVPPLLLISMDGFRADYLQRKITPSVQRIMQCGAHAQYMLPSYPSKTFPNHYTIVTGLYPESHGIVDNHFYDEEMPDEKNFAKSSRNPVWYNGEPIWNTVSKNGKKSAIFFWPGSEVPIQGMLPTYRYNYNASLPFSKRVDQVIDWLRLDETDRPAFLAMYFEQPDTAMHREGPDSDAVNSALIYVDAMINYLMQQLDNHGFLGCINLVILSDHGAQKLREDHFIALDQFVDARDPEVGGVFGGTIGHINFRNSASQAFIERVLAPMSCLGGQTFRVYTRDSMPKRYHYTKSGRIGEIVIDSVGGTRLFVDQRSLREHGSLEKGDHGYDNRMREMRAIFGAWGPSIKRAYEEKPFQNIELYNLFTALMQLPVSAPNNGTAGRLHSILRQPPSLDSQPIVELAECEGARLVKCGDGCHFELNYQSGSVSVPSSPDSSPAAASSSADSSSANSPPSGQSTTKVPVYNGQHCKYADRMLMPAKFADQGRQCLIRLCNSTLVFNRCLRMANFVESQLSAPIPNIDHRANCTAHFVVPNPAAKGMGGMEGGNEGTTTAAAMGQMDGGNDGGPIGGGKRSRSTDDDSSSTEANAHNEESHSISDPTVATHPTQGDEHAPWERPAEMGDNTVGQETSTIGQMEGGGMAENGTATTTMAADTQPIQPSPTLQSPLQLECARLQQQNAAVPSSTPASADANALWISLFPDNDYARYIFQGQFRVPQGFYTGPWKQILSLLRQYVQHYKRLLMWSGPVFDHDHDGLADPILAGADASEGPTPSPSSSPSDGLLLPSSSPSHIFLILLRCSNNTWAANGRQCEDPANTKTLAFVLPLVEKDLNCLFPVEYIFRHTARIKDIELLTGNEWFLDRQIYPEELAIRLRTQINEQLWQLELKS